MHQDDFRVEPEPLLFDINDLGVVGMYEMTTSNVAPYRLYYVEVKDAPVRDRIVRKLAGLNSFYLMKRNIIDEIVKEAINKAIVKSRE